MEYGYPEKRKTKGDKKAKARYMRYKRGGALRSSNVDLKRKEEGKK